MSEFLSYICKVTRGNAKCVKRQLFANKLKIVNAGLTVVIIVGGYLLIV